MHSVLHHWCFHTFEENKATISWLALIIVASAVPSESVLHYSLIQRRLLPHCNHVYSIPQRYLQDAFKNREYLPSLSRACYNLGYLYSNQGKMKEAEDIYLRALAGKEKAWGPEHTSTLDTVNNLGLLYTNQGKIKEAEDMYLRALVGYEKAWGPEHTSTLGTVNNLGSLYSKQGKMKEAEDMYLRALAGYEKAWAPEHKQALDTRYNLGLLYKERYMFGKAVQQFELVVRGYTKLLGPEHSETVEALNQLENL